MEKTVTLIAFCIAVILLLAFAKKVVDDSAGGDSRVTEASTVTLSGPPDVLGSSASASRFAV